jgi:hypothetical protein
VLNAEGEQLGCGQSLVARVNRVRLHISVSTICFGNDSKVSGTKRCNKTTGAYSGIPGDDMQEGLLKGKRNPPAAQNRAKPYAAATRHGVRWGAIRFDMCENQ